MKVKFFKINLQKEYWLLKLKMRKIILILMLIRIKRIIHLNKNRRFQINQVETYKMVFYKIELMITQKWIKIQIKSYLTKNIKPNKMTKMNKNCRYKNL